MSASDPLIGQVIDGKYRLEGKLGQGGMGSVHRATHLGTDRVVALKLIAPGLTEREDFLDRFQREARAAGCLRHPNIVDLTDFGFAESADGPLAYLVMEFLEGESLDALLRRNPMPPLAFTVDVVQQVCSALQEAHGHGIVHRDLKPDNLWLEPNRRGGFTVKILDFGLAKIYDPQTRAMDAALTDQDDTATQAIGVADTSPVRISSGSGGKDTQLGTVLGTPAYMSPEQCRGIGLGPRSDLYSLGIIAFQMLAGRTPFAGSSLDLINMHIQSEVPDLRKERKDLPRGLAELVMETLCKDPARRPETAELFGNAFEACAQSAAKLLQQAIVLLLERWGEIRPLLWPIFAPPVLLAVLLFAGFSAFGEDLSSGAWTLGSGILIAAVLSWCFFGVAVLKGRLSPLVLQHLLFPLRSLDPSTRFLDRAQNRSHLRFAALGALFMFLLFLIPTGLVAITRMDIPNDSMLKYYIVCTGVLGWGSVIAWVIGSRGYGGQSVGILPCVMFVEGLGPAAAGNRIVQLKQALKARGFDPDRIATEGMWSGMALTAAVFVLGAGAGILSPSLGTGNAPGLLAYSLWFGIFLLAGWGFLGALDAILTALAYLRVRKLARESLKGAFENLRKRQERLALR